MESLVKHWSKWRWTSGELEWLHLMQALRTSSRLRSAPKHLSHDCKRDCHLLELPGGGGWAVLVRDEGSHGEVQASEANIGLVGRPLMEFPSCWGTIRKAPKTKGREVEG